MEQFKRFTQGTLGKVIATIIVLPFVAAGFYGYFAGGAGADQVAKVGKQSISKTELSNRIQQTRQQLRQSNPDLNAEALAELVSPRSVLDGLISNALLDQAAIDENIVVSQDQVSDDVVQATIFQDDDGNFSRDIFRQYVSRLGYSPTGFFALLQQQEARQQLKSAYMLTAFTTPRELATQVALAGQKRSVEYTRLSRDEQIAKNHPTEAAAKAWYQDHKSDYVRPAQMRVQWLEVSPKNYDIKLTEEQIQQEYTARKKMLENAAEKNQKRQLADIFIAIDKDRDADAAMALATDVRKKLDAGESFDTLAAEYSDDLSTAKQGGKLGWLQKDALPEVLADTAFALQKNEISEPVSVDDGVHLIKVLGIQATKIPSLASMREQIVKELKEQEMQARISHDSNELGDLAFEHGDLVEIGNQLDLPIQTSDWFDPLKPTGFIANPAIVKALEDEDVIEHNQNSRLLDLGDNRYVVLHLLDRRDASQLAFADVKTKATKDLAIHQANEQFDTLAKEADNAKTLADIAAKWHASTHKATALTRQSTQLPADVLQQVFQQAPVASDDLHVVRDGEGDLWAFILTDVSAGPAIPKSQLTQAMGQLSLMNGESDFNTYLDWLQSTTKVTLNQDRIETLN